MRADALYRLRVCLSWIRSLRRLRRKGAFGAMEEAALEWNLCEARRCANVLRRT